MSSTIAGNRLHGNADPNATYLTQRTIQVLRDVGAVDADQAAIIDRADKIGLGNRNNVAEATEVDRLWAADVHPTLFPEEQRALETVWERFRVQSTDFAAPNVPVINAASFREIPANVGAVDTEQPFLIANLPAELQRIARRVQLTIDNDRNPPSIQYADILSAIRPENAQKYTAQENQQIKELQRRFLEEILPRQVVGPQLEVPPLGEHHYRLAAEPGIEVNLVTQSELTLTQSASKHVRSANVRANGVTDISNNLHFQRKAIGIHFEVPADHKMVVIGDRSERVLGPGPVALPPQPGRYILELYDAQGNKVRDKSFTVPNVDVDMNLSDQHARKAIVSNGRALDPELVSYSEAALNNRPHSARHFLQGTRHGAVWRYVQEDTAQHQGDINAANAAFTWSGGTLKDGTYTFSAQPLTQGAAAQRTVLEKYPGPLFSATVNGEKFWLVPYGPSNYAGPELNGRLLFRAFQGPAGRQAEVFFEPATNTLEITRWHGNGRGTTHWKHVVKAEDFSEGQGI